MYNIMNIVFFGTSKFAVTCLERLLTSGHEVSLVVTRPDRQKGRSLKMSPPPVKEAVISKGIKVIQPERPDQNLIGELKKVNADIFVVIAYGHILKKEILGLPKYFSINVHTSLLPKYRGAAPVNWAIINGEKKTGVSIIKMNEFMDAGDIIAKKEIGIGPMDDALSVDERLADVGKELLIEALKSIENGSVKFEKQDDKEATIARKLVKQDGLIDWQLSAPEIHNRVRGMVPWPGAYTFLNNKKLNIWKSDVLEDSGTPGKVIRVEKDKIQVGAGKGAVSILEVQLEDKKRMMVSDFLRGYRTIKEGDHFG